MNNDTFRYEYVRTLDAVPDRIPNDGILYVDVETYPGPRGTALDLLDCRLRIVSVVGNGGVVYVFDMLFLPYGAVWSLLAGCTLCGHNFNFDLTVMRRHGMPYPPAARCTMLGSQVLMNGCPPSAGGHGLGECVKRYLEREIVKDQGGSDWSSPDLSERQLQYAAEDAFQLRDLHNHLLERLGVRRLNQIYQIECNMLPAVVDMRLNGVCIDVPVWTARSEKAMASLVSYETELLDHLPPPDPIPHKKVRLKKSGEPYAADLTYNERVDEENLTRKWNLASHDQVREVFKRINVFLPNTQYETLIEHADDHPNVDLLIKWKDLEKEATTFGLDWLKHLRGDRVHPNWRQLWPVSGRMSCADPNLQQIPRGICRKGIVSSPGHVFVRCDFSQIEARVACKISGDRVMMNLFQTGDDIHAYAAKAVLRRDAITPDERQIGKSLVFGLLFSMSAPALRIYCRTNYGVKFTAVEAELFRDRFFQAFPGLKGWHDKTRKTCNHITEVRSLLGRRRVIFARTEDEHVNMLGIALNTPVQGTAADMMKAAVGEVWERRGEKPFRLCMLVHDEIVLEVPEARGEDVGQWLRKIMIDTGNQIIDPVPVDAAVKIGRSWGG